MIVVSGYSYQVDLGISEKYPILDSANAVFRPLDSSSAIVFHPLLQDGLKQRRSGVILAMKLLRLNLRVSAQEVLKQIIAFYLEVECQ